MKSTKRKVLICLLTVVALLTVAAVSVTANDNQLPNAEVINLGATTVDVDSYYKYDLIGGTGLSTGKDPFDLQIAMQFLAKDTPEEAAANAYGNYTTDFFITMSGIEGGSSAANGCYLAGYYPSFGAWVIIPLDNFSIEDGVTYPVITSAGFDFEYVDICESVQNFVCGIYLSDEFRRANPDLQIELELGLSETYDKAIAADYVSVGSYVYDSYLLGLGDKAVELEASKVTVGGEEVTEEMQNTLDAILADINANPLLGALETNFGANKDKIDSAKNELVSQGAAEEDVKVATPIINITLADVVIADKIPQRMTFDVTPTIAVGDKSVALNNFNVALKFRLPIYSAEANECARVYHEGDYIGIYDIKSDDSGSKYVEIESNSFSEFAVEPTATPTGSLSSAYTSESTYWGECGGNASESFEFKFYNGNTYMGYTSLNNIDDIIDGEVYVSWHIKLDAESNTDEYWDMAWDIAPTLSMQPNRVEQWVDGVKVAECTLQFNWSDGIFPIIAAVADADGKILSYVNNRADFTLANALNTSANNASSVVMLKDVILENTLVISAGKVITLDLNGFTISQVKECTDSYEMIKNNGTLTITGNGKISFTDTSAGDASASWGAYTIRNEGTLIVENGTIENLSEQNVAGQDFAHTALAIFQYSGSTTINGGTVSGPYYRSIRLWKGDMTINGGNIVGQVWVQCVDDSAKLTINGGSFAPVWNDGSSVFVGNITTSSIHSVEFYVTGGYFSTKIGANDPTAITGGISGGIFTAAAKNGTNAALIVDGYEFEQNEDGTYGVAKAPVATVNGVEYSSLQDAINASNAGDTVTLLKDVILENTLVISAGKVITLDLNGFTISQVKECTDSYEMIKNNGTLTITGNGKISFTDTSAGDASASWGAYTIRNEGTLIVENGTIENLSEQNVAGQDFAHTALAIFQYSGSTTINGGTVSGPYYRSIRLWKGDMTINGGNIVGQVWVQCVDDSAKLTINGGSFAPVWNDGSSVFVGNITTSSIHSVEFYVTGGYFSTKIGANDPTAITGGISGGVFTADAKNNTNAELVADGIILVPNADETVFAAIKPAEFLGGSLRFADAVTGYTNMRFGYKFDESFVFDGATWGWIVTIGEKSATRVGQNFTTDNRTNLVITNIPMEMYATDIKVQLYYVILVDGIEFTVTDEVVSRNVLDVATAVASDENELLEARDYANKLVTDYNNSTEQAYLKKEESDEEVA